MIKSNLNGYNSLFKLIETKITKKIQNLITVAPPNFFRPKPYIFDNHMDHFNFNFLSYSYY